MAPLPAPSVALLFLALLFAYCQSSTTSKSLPIVLGRLDYYDDKPDLTSPPHPSKWEGDILHSSQKTSSFITQAYNYNKMFNTFSNPVVNDESHVFKKQAKSVLPDELQYHGTTTLAFKLNDSSIVVAVDSRASIGDYVGSRSVKKIFPITKYVIGTMAGGAADCAFFIRRAAKQARVLLYNHNFNNHCSSDGDTTNGGGGGLDSKGNDEEDVLFRKASVRMVSRILSTSLRDMKSSGLSVGTMVAGYDFTVRGGAGQLFYVDSEGTCVEGDCFCVGSGSQLAYSILDEQSSLRSLDLESAVNVAVSAISVAAYRDGYSGGYINVLHISDKGCKHVMRVDSRDILNRRKGLII